MEEEKKPSEGHHPRYAILQVFVDKVIKLLNVECVSHGVAKLYFAQRAGLHLIAYVTSM